MVIVPDLQDQHCRLPKLGLLQGEGSRPAPDAHLPLSRKVVEMEHEAPVEVPLPSQRVECTSVSCLSCSSPFTQLESGERCRPKGHQLRPSPEHGSLPSLPLGSPTRPLPPPSSRHLIWLRGQGSGSTRGPKPLFAISPQYTAICPARSADLPLHIDVTRHLSCEWVHISQNHILRVPDDDSEFIAEGYIGGEFSDP